MVFVIRCAVLLWVSVYRECMHFFKVQMSYDASSLGNFQYRINHYIILLNYYTREQFFINTTHMHKCVLCLT